MTQPDFSVAQLRDYFSFGFPTSREAWHLYEIGPIFDNHSPLPPTLVTIRRLADHFNRKRILTSHAYPPVHAGQLVAAGAIVDLMRYVVWTYAAHQNPHILAQGIEEAARRQGTYVAELPPAVFVHLFPPRTVFQGELSESDFLAAPSAPLPSRESATAEMLLLSLAVENPAFLNFRSFFDDSELQRKAPYRLLIERLEQFLAAQPPFSPLGQPLLECLRAPMRACPDSLEGQLRYIRQYWSPFLPAQILDRLLLATDVLQEEERARGLGPGPAQVLRFDRSLYPEADTYSEPACFSPDANWMPNVVLMAKSTHVWLDQLSRKYQREIRHLNDIPDEELDTLARWGFTGLWLIGIWERSSASQRIKQIMGNPEAAASAYSLYDYVIAADLGGESAYTDLNHRARQRGIRLASDMVPNHTGIASKWVSEHPDWFIQRPEPPFPCYSFNGEDLSNDPNIVIQIEDGYWDHRDASVVFKRYDKNRGDTRYIYHGNDGTSMPWNDTAQLNFLMPEVREAVIQTILHVARQFPIIRFDAAMTLAKRHYQRLWFPKQGEGGAIPSRAEAALTRADFDAAFPVEFWREVVDRVAAEAPDTLLLAEAFWLMEGYFVRTLGMHRVYNSAFMNMLRDEQNTQYRQTIRNVLEFSPQVLQRFVNFMNNPDERTAVDQFGRNGKYFGISMLMVTMPGLPMFGHGQVEGFAEKYGMEYRRAYWNEEPDSELVRQHEREIFPLARRRYLFSGAENFALYDFITHSNQVDENVFAYSNRVGEERALFFYNNSYTETTGRIHTATPVNIASGDERHLVQRSLTEALGLRVEPDLFYAFRDLCTGLEYLRHSNELATVGVFASLHAYQRHAFLDFRPLTDPDGSWSRLAGHLSGRGVPDLEEARRELELEPLLTTLRQMLSEELFESEVEEMDESLLRATLDRARQFYTRLSQQVGTGEDPIENICERIGRELLFHIEYTQAQHRVEAGETEPPTEPAADPDKGLKPVIEVPRHVSLAWLLLRHVAAYASAAQPMPSLVRELLLLKSVRERFESRLHNPDAARYDCLLVELLLTFPDLLDVQNAELLSTRFHALVNHPIARKYLCVNEYEGKAWFNREQYERLLAATLECWLMRHDSEAIEESDARDAEYDLCDQSYGFLLEAARLASWQVEETVAQLEALERSLLEFLTLTRSLAPQKPHGSDS
jgi:glycosidase